MAGVKQPKRDRKRNQRWLAGQLGCTQQRVSKLMRRDGWRWTRFGWTDEEVAEIREWRQTLRDENPATSDDPEIEVDRVADIDIGQITDMRELLLLVKKPEQRIKLSGVIERAAKVKVDRELLLGGYLKKEEVELGQVARVQAVRQELANVRLLAIRLENKSVPAMERELEDWARGVCMKFERGMAA